MCVCVCVCVRAEEQEKQRAELELGKVKAEFHAESEAKGKKTEGTNTAPHTLRKVCVRVSTGRLMICGTTEPFLRLDPW